MMEPRVASVAFAIDRKGFATVTVTHVFEEAAAERTVVYTGSDLVRAKEAVDTWTAKIGGAGSRLESDLEDASEHEPNAAPARAGIAEAVLMQSTEVERLQSLIQAAVRVTGWDLAPSGDCPLCLELIVPDSAESGHEDGCPWPAFLAEAAR
jgi:hypothetical protein